MTGEEIARAIGLASFPAPAPLRFRVVGPECLEDLAAKSGRSLRELEILALQAGIVPEKYRRNFDAFTAAEQIGLLESRVALIGLGGLGGFVLELLARAGVGRVRAADGDVFEASNLNRQLLSQAGNIGQTKAEAALARAAAVNPACEVQAISAFVDEASVDEFVAGCDLAVDALGGLAMRREFAEAAAKAGITLVSAGVAGNTGWVAAVEPCAACPARFLATGRGQAAEAVSGTPAPAVATAAAIMAGAALDALRGKKPGLTGKMLLFDLFDASFETVHLGLHPGA